MVTHGAWDWTERALTSVTANTETSHEIILVDNASLDGTPGRVRASFGDAVSVIENRSNLGFGPATNQAARAARAPLLALLNSDAIVMPGWDQSLVKAFDRNPSVGAAVPRLFHPDGRLQEAGALLGADGTVASLGDGDNPEELAYRFPRAVDFGAAACMMVRTDAFRSVDGFDPLYAPAYYEDADLCLRLADLGLRTMYEPSAGVMHGRFGSGSIEQAQVMSERNRKRFVDRWGHALVTRPPTLVPLHTARLLAARDAVVAGRILVLGRTPTESKSLVELLAYLVRWIPSLRISLTVSRAGDEIERLLAWGVEVSVVAPVMLAAWSGQRALHYDLIFATDAALAEQVGRSQSIASVHLLPLTLGRIIDIMESAGLGERR